MLDLLARVTYTRRRLVLIVAGLLVGFAAVWGTGVFPQLSGGGFEDPDSESSRAAELLEQELGRTGADVVLVYRSSELTVRDAGFADPVTAALAALPATDVAEVTDYWSTGAPQFATDDGRATYVLVRLAGSSESAQTDQLEAIEPLLAVPGLDLEIGGPAAVARDIDEQVGEDIARAESISFPILFVLLVVIFGGLIAASLPLLIGGIAVLGAFTVLRVFTLFTDVSVFAINIVTLLGLGLAIDYGLFMVSRFREELEDGQEVAPALRRTLQTAGRTVLVSGVTVAIALSGLMLFPQNFLRSMGMGGVAAVLVAMVAALTVLPAMLALIGHRIDSLSLRPFIRRVTGRGAARPVAAAAGSSSGVWYRLARSVMRRPVLYVVVVGVLLLALATPFLRISFGGIDARALPVGTPSRSVSESLAADFGVDPDPALILAVTLADPIDGAGQGDLDAYLAQVAAVPGVGSAEITGAAGTTARVDVQVAGDPISEESREIVGQVRSLALPAGASVLVGGQTAILVDLLDSLGSILPWMALLVAVASFVLLFLAFGSVVLPLKAIVMNVLSLGATFGVLVLVFQDGNLSGLLGFTPTGTIEATQPILVLAVAFGLSMDYEVFLLSRIREQYDRTGENTEAVAAGLQRTGGIITSAAVLLIVVIGAFATSGITFIKLIGVAMVVAIVVDATLVRALLVPATMRLLGNLNWWVPGPLRRVYDRVGIREDGPAGHDGDDAGPARAEERALSSA
ncbi:MAG: MMPL family transporter [Geodermatophilaceae bacterium]|nr:MMPL family transporter [Geodermatophilaceae bacterium]